MDASNGDMFFTWANSDSASSASEWETPSYIPSVSSANSSPDFVTDASGRTVVAFAVPINEERGIYIVETGDFGTSWSTPYRVFDASAVNWHMVDRPEISITGDGRLHILFERYALSGEQRHSIGLYYIQSSDGGVTWSQPELVSEHPVLWSKLFGYGTSTLHRIWQEQGNSTRTSMHQLSSDGGTSWSSPTVVSSLDDAVLDHVSMDPLGNLYLLQLAGSEEPRLLDQRWDVSGWKLEEPLKLDINSEEWVPSSIVSSVSSNGYLVASILLDSLDSSAEKQRELLSITQFLDPSETIPTPYPALIATAGPGLMGTQEVLEIFETPIPASPLAGIQETQSFWLKNRNLVGLSLLGGIVILLVVFFLLGSRSNDKSKKKTH